MGVVEGLDVGLDASATSDLLLVHGLCDGKRATLDTSDDSVSIVALSVTVVVGLDDDGLGTGILTLSDNDNLSGFTGHKWDDGREKRIEAGTRETRRRRGVQKLDHCR